MGNNNKNQLTTKMMNYFTIAALAFAASTSAKIMGNNDVNDDASCPDGFLGCDKSTWAPKTSKQCAFGELGCDPNTLPPKMRPAEPVDVCYYVPADTLREKAHNVVVPGADSSSWAPTIVYFDHRHDANGSILNVINRQQIIVNVDYNYQTPIFAYGYDAPDQEGALILDDDKDQGVCDGNSGYCTWYFHVKGCMTSEELSITGKAASLDGITQEDIQLSMTVNVGKDRYAKSRS